MARIARILRYATLGLGAIAALLPFYYMLIGALQKKRDTGLGGLLPKPSNLTLDNLAGIDDSFSLLGALANSLIMTLGVVVCTLVFGLLAGYALAILRFRGRGMVFALVLLVQAIPFQLLMIPLYVMVVRYFGLADSYAGMILPFAINSVAVLIFRQYFLQIPREIFDAARMDGASELRILRSVAVPLVRPAILTAMLVTFIGPWNEFLWPFLVTKDQGMQPLAVSLANFSQANSTFQANPMGAVLAGACVLAVPAVVLFLLFQRHFTSANLGSAIKG
ncbi:carbohydrate ABC transporter permease [Streptomyces antimycoticus]|uniref:Carbohydrate ABC transporter permease n=1 Tax=Streptomyces antimycoticus TaxID=68175 RepID=A0ABD5JL17_9ACTN|nr:MULTISPECIES: carbohydrate ABC transporter permease [Streptomyces]MEE4589115.1 carbohydrate ABC transporter permease [Streptomyces sp. DSM 41602]WJE02474.1 carbohydrate ABC transporter permease [Streptomyces antimycoticus]WTA86880.1 carbohydrate ABC transporter permease [Streptomyces antimycoticus]WTB11888.1 carbohydrate ABC transporter permease [Streptomyces antimycoticus]